MLNLESLKIVEKASAKKKAGEKKGREQKFDVQFQRSVQDRKEGKVTISRLIFSEKRFAALNLAERGLRQVYDGTSVGLAVVSEENAKFFKGRKAKDGTQLEKGRAITSDMLENSLISTGLIDAEILGNQPLSLVLVPGSEGFDLGKGVIAVGGVYEIVKAETETEEEAEAEASFGENI